jgi:hypothetical protein
MRLTSLLALLATAALAGPVGRYLGFEVHRQGDAIGAARDSFHYLIPNPGDTIIVRNHVDTTTIVAETVRVADSAWVIRQVTHPTLETEVTDTSYESGDTLLCSRQVLGDSVRWLNAYRVPFSIGTTWSFGLAGTYLYDFTGDSIMDTLTIWADTCSVLDTEDVTVPFGLVPHCHKIRRVMYQRLATEQSGVPVIESSYIRTFEWYKDSLWSIKESTQAFGPIYTWIFVWLHAADFVSTDVTQLNGLGYVGIAAEPEPATGRALRAEPSVFLERTIVTVPPGHATQPLQVYNSAGRLARVLCPPQSPTPNPYSLSWDGRDNTGRRLPAGAYFIRTGNAVCRVTKLR